VRVLVACCALLLSALAVASSSPGETPASGPPLVSTERVIANRSDMDLVAPAIASDGVGYLVVWHSEAASENDIFGALVSSEGDVLAPGPFPIASGPGGQALPSVAWDGDKYLVVWSDDRGYPSALVNGAFVSRDGTVSGAFPVSAASFPRNEETAVAFNGTEFLVAWQAETQSGYEQDIVANRVTRDGVRLDGNGFVVTGLQSNETAPDVASDGTNFLVSFVSIDLPRIVRVSASGTVLDPIMKTLSGFESSRPQAAFGGGVYLAVFSEYFLRQDVDGTRVATDGQVLDPNGLSIATTSSLEEYPAVAWDQGVFETVWAERPNTIGTYDLRGARVTADGVVLDPSGYNLTASGSSESSPDAVGGPPGRTAVAYLRPTGVGGTLAVALRFLDRGPVASTNNAQPTDAFAFLYGTVDPNGLETRAWFEWGRTPALGSSTPEQVVQPGAQASLSDEISSLESFTTYYFRMRAENASGSGIGAIHAFTTLDTVLPPPRGCLVPRVVGRKLAVARPRIRRARCSVGRIRRTRSRRPTGTVLSQIPRAGVQVRLHTRVRLVVSRGRR
jgi:hypothetical protein